MIHNLEYKNMFVAPIWVKFISILCVDFTAQGVHFITQGAMWRLHIVHHSDKKCVDATTVIKDITRLILLSE
jgi:sterol desaturase/sphingolipid hydroxylase (fatty acid hydroxylase superfamily)